MPRHTQQQPNKPAVSGRAPGATPRQAVTKADLSNAAKDLNAASPDAIVRLQQQYGNRAVSRLLKPDTARPDGTQPARPRPAGPQGGQAEPSVEAQLAAAKGGGSPLPDDTRGQSEGQLGADFSGVRLHTDPGAQRLNRQLGARAFTHGQDIFFGRGTYQPGSLAGRRLLAHELAHVVQQNPQVTSGGVPAAAGPAARPSIQREPLTAEELRKINEEAQFQLTEPITAAILKGINAYIEAAPEQEAGIKGAALWVLININSGMDEAAILKVVASEVDSSTSSRLGTNLFPELFPEAANPQARAAQPAIPQEPQEEDDGRYDFGFEADTNTAIRRKRRMSDWLDHCRDAGLSFNDVMLAAQMTLSYFGGWEHSALRDIDHMIHDRFVDNLVRVVPGATRPIAAVCAEADPDPDQLRQFASQMPPPVQYPDRYIEPDFADEAARSFNDQESADIFHKLWVTATPGQAWRIYSVMRPRKKKFQRVSEIGYLLEAVDRQHRYGLTSQAKTWLRGVGNVNFFGWLESLTGDAANQGITPVKYYNYHERQQFQVTVGPTLQYPDRRPLRGDNIFVMDSHRQIYAAGKETSGAVRIHHSSFLAGDAVRAAGHLITDDGGKLVAVNNSSGHYQPDLSHLAQALAILEKGGVKLDQVSASGIQGEQLTAKELLDRYL